MKNKNMDKALAFNDVLIKPRKCVVTSRSDIDLTQSFLGYNFEIPIVSANMSTVTEYQMILSMASKGGLPILHRMMPLKEQLNILHKVDGAVCGASIEGSLSGISNAKSLLKMGASIICIDVAHADSDQVIHTATEFINKFPKTPLIIGNIATAEAIDNFIEVFTFHGIDMDYVSKYISFKVGVGSGSQCTTRIVTGCGLPTLESLLEIKYHHGSYLNLIADGGIKNSGDIVKCFVAGAKMVMLGSLIAGTKESPGNVIKYKNNLFKIYRGSASYGQKHEIKSKINHIEGEETLVPYRGSVEDVLQSLCEGIKSGISYAGCSSLRDLFGEAGKSIEMMVINHAGYIESTAHGA